MFDCQESLFFCPMRDKTCGHQICDKGVTEFLSWIHQKYLNFIAYDITPNTSWGKGHHACEQLAGYNQV